MDAQIIGKLLCVADGVIGAVGGGHENAENVLRAEGLSCDRANNRAVNAAAESKYNLLKATLSRVVFYAQHERLPNLFISCRDRRQNLSFL